MFLTTLLLSALHGPTAHDSELFEREIRPVLVERCYRCHNSVDRREGGLALDHAEGLLSGGDSGPAIVPGAPDRSLLLRAVRHESGAPRMPEDEPRLEPAQLDAFAAWIAAGAPDPRDAPPSAADLAAETSWEAVRERRLEWWSFQPLEAPTRPSLEDASWAREELDHYVLAGFEAQGAAPTPEVDRATWLRRASYAATGLPPTPAQIEAFLADEGADAHERAVDGMLASPHYAERFARHWMDLFRYAESHGSEGDPTIQHAYRYRDYLIRAFEADVPWDRMAQESIAGDLLSSRLEPESGINDAALGTAHLRFVQHGYAPTDPLEEQVRFVDNQIDVVSKALLGLTVSCARCHDHKFDPISQADYTALYGVLASVRPAMRTVDSEERRALNADALEALSSELRAGLADAWLQSSSRLPELLNADGPAQQEARERGVAHPLHLWVASAEGETSAHWQSARAELEASRARLSEVRASASAVWNLGGEGARLWFAHGSVLEAAPSGAGAFAVLPEGERVLDGLLPSGVYSHLVSNRHAAVLSSPLFDVGEGELWVRAMGGGGARLRYSMQGYPRVAGPVYKAHDLNASAPVWLRWNMDYWAGDRAFLELATARDIPVEARGQERSWWGVEEALFVPRGAPAPREELAESCATLLDAEAAPTTRDELAARYLEVLRGAIERWREGSCTSVDARFLDPFVRHGLLPNSLGELSELAPLVERYRALELEIPTPTRAPGVSRGVRIDQQLYTRGDHQQPEQPVAQRFFEWLDPTPYTGDGRLALARDLVRADNPLTARVAANRLWTWTFGEGLVATTENFGLLGTPPSNPALLDHLASELVAEGWSIKRTLRRLLLSSAFRQERAPRRLDAESLRDALLLTSGRLDTRRFGGSVNENSTRRSLYVGQRRGSPPPFLATFDQPAPHTTVGSRALTNVPAQALALLNDQLVANSAQAWASRALGAAPVVDDVEGVHLERMIAEAYGRAPRAGEVERMRGFLAAARSGQQLAGSERSALQALALVDERMIAELLERARERVLAERERVPAGAATDLPEPIAAWEFEGDLTDAVGELHGVAHGDARVEGGRLRLDGTGFVLTSPLASELGAKTLEVWVQLDDLEQRNPGVITVQTNDGGVFDSIVYAERQRRRWIAGSDGFRRTRDLDGLEEASGELVHMAVAYDEDGTIRLYRDGQSYGQSYRPGGLVRYDAGGSQVLLGARHGAPGSMRAPLRGSIERASLYDRALAPEEIAASASGERDYVSRPSLLLALSAQERAELEALQLALATARSRIQELASDAGGGVKGPWHELAHALFLTEEFRFVR